MKTRRGMIFYLLALILAATLLSVPASAADTYNWTASDTFDGANNMYSTVGGNINSMAPVDGWQLSSSRTSLIAGLDAGRKDNALTFLTNNYDITATKNFTVSGSGLDPNGVYYIKYDLKLDIAGTLDGAPFQIRMYPDSDAANTTYRMQAVANGDGTHKLQVNQSSTPIVLVPVIDAATTYNISIKLDMPNKKAYTTIKYGSTELTVTSNQYNSSVISNYVNKITMTLGKVGTTWTRSVVMDNFYYGRLLPKTDADYVQEDKSLLTIPASSNIADNMLLTSLGAINSSTITWASSDPEISFADTNTAGKVQAIVTRPRASEGQKSVTLTATITKGTASDTKVFNVTVAPSVVVDNYEYLTEDTFSAGNQAYNNESIPADGYFQYALDSWNFASGRTGAASAFVKFGVQNSALNFGRVSSNSYLSCAERRFASTQQTGSKGKYSVEFDLSKIILNASAGQEQYTQFRIDTLSNKNSSPNIGFLTLMTVYNGDGTYALTVRQTGPTYIPVIPVINSAASYNVKIYIDMVTKKFNVAVDNGAAFGPFDFTPQSLDFNGDYSDATFAKVRFSFPRISDGTSNINTTGEATIDNVKLGMSKTLRDGIEKYQIRNMTFEDNTGASANAATAGGKIKTIGIYSIANVTAPSKLFFGAFHNGVLKGVVVREIASMTADQTQTLDINYTLPDTLTGWTFNTYIFDNTSIKPYAVPYKK